MSQTRVRFPQLSSCIAERRVDLDGVLVLDAGFGKLLFGEVLVSAGVVGLLASDRVSRARGGNETAKRHDNDDEYGVAALAHRRVSISKDPSARRFGAKGLKMGIFHPRAGHRLCGSSQKCKPMPEIQSEQDYLT